MHICLLADAQSIHTSRWCEYLSGRGHDLNVISFRPSELPGGRVYAFQRGECLGKARYLFYLLSIRRLILRLQPDILHAHHATSYGLAGAFSGWHPFLVHTWGRDVLDFPKRLSYRALVNFNLSRADVITCTSKAMARAVRSLAKTKTPVHVIPFGVDVDQFQPPSQPRALEEPLVIGVVKALEPIYGLEVLLRAFAELQPETRKLRLLIVGDGTQHRALQSLSHDLGIANATRFVGGVPHDQVIHYLHKMDIFVVPSLQESFGVAAVEAAATGLPVVASDVGGLPEVVIDGETGYLVPPADARVLSQRLAHLIAEPALRRRMGEAGRALVETHYNWQDNAAQMERLYRSLVKE